MRKLTLWLLKLGITNREDYTDQQVRTRYGLVAGWTSIAVNLVLFVIKLVIGLLSGSIAIAADAFHSLSDAASSVAVVVVFEISGRPSDAEHPYGHGRAEYIGALVLAVFLFVIGIEFFRSSFERLLTPRKLNISYFSLVAIAITVVVKELLGRFTSVIAELTNSQSLKADAWHHRSDAISSILVIAAMIGGRIGVYWLDGAMGIAVAFIMGGLGFKIFKNSADSLLGNRPSEDLLKSVCSIAGAIDGVLSVHDISVHSYGATKMISLHAQVADSVSPVEAHRIAERIEKSIEKELKSVRTVVHIDPVDVGSPFVLKVVAEIRQFKKENPQVESFHDVRLREDGQIRTIELDIAMAKGTTTEDSKSLKEALAVILSERFPDYEANIDIDPDYFYQKPK